MALTNAQYDEIMRSYQDRQIARQHLIAAREAEVEERTPRLAELNAAIAHAGVAEAKRRLSGTDESADPRESISALAAERRALLASLGYPEDYLAPPYVCPDCRDTGYIGQERCHCFRQAAIDLVYAQSNLTALFDEECFANFSLDYYAKDVIDKGTGISSYDAAKDAYERCRRFAADFDTSFQNLYLFGDTGVGKTFLSHCVAGELLGTGHSVLYFSAARLFDLLADQAFGRSGAENADTDGILTCDLLIIDDLGTELTNSFTLSRFFVCLNERLLRRRSTLISSNLDLASLASIYSERIFSRIIRHFTVLHLFGKDIRVLQQL